MLNSLKSLVRLGACVAVAACGGAVATALHLPLGWLIGSLLVTAALSIQGIPMKVVPYGRELSQGLVGIAAGQRLSPEVAERLLSLLPIMVVATLATIVVACLQSRLLARLTGTDPQTAFFSSLPGGVAEMTVLTERYGGDPGLVSVAQFLRILVVTLTVPQIVGFLHHPAAEVAALALASQETDLPLLLICALGVVSGFLFSRCRIPNGWLLAGVLSGSFAGLTQMRGVSVPWSALICAQVLIGLALGTRCKRSLLRSGRFFLPANVAGTAALIAVAMVITMALDHWFGLGQASLLLALAPGGIAEMSLVATSSHLDLVLVVAFHLVRVLLIIGLSVPLYRLFVRKDLGSR